MRVIGFAQDAGQHLDTVPIDSAQDRKDGQESSTQGNASSLIHSFRYYNSAPQAKANDSAPADNPRESRRMWELTSITRPLGLPQTGPGSLR